MRLQTSVKNSPCETTATQIGFLALPFPAKEFHYEASSHTNL
jgi:hypothetical protein